MTLRKRQQAGSYRIFVRRGCASRLQISVASLNPFKEAKQARLHHIAFLPDTFHSLQELRQWLTVFPANPSCLSLRSALGACTSGRR
jgi:hypothetical protein